MNRYVLEKQLANYKLSPDKQDQPIKLTVDGLSYRDDVLKTPLKNNDVANALTLDDQFKDEKIS